ncbi:hypothetical protein MPL3365_230082 [Mesorhizobium plurifarium]|uniref:Peptidase M41 domain-containing protein n=1 Tax=Mesorhizobium plurifarium TaxID=69974 RepID=A0A090G4F3_MESPL|nr:hypothetical protein MPL3365_230082 [Mesorhizobium plurifarium]
MARQSVTRFGMSSALGQAVLEEQKQQWLGDGSLRQRDYSEATAREVDIAVRQMLDEAFAAAQDLLRSRMADLKAGAGLLLERETITPDDFPPLRRSSPTTAQTKKTVEVPA